MAITNIKSEIIQKINSIKDDKLLEEINEMIDNEIYTQDVYVLSEAEREAIGKGKNDIKEGKYYSNEEANELVRGCLKK